MTTDQSLIAGALPIFFSKTMMTTNNRDASIPWTLHDYISLGEVEQGLSMTSTHNDSQAQEEIQRLPLFLRLLSTTRHLVSISIFDTSVGEETDPLVHRTVERLERVAAIHSVAEGVDVVTCYLVPTMTRKLSRVSPLTRALDTSELTEVARNPKGNPSRKKQRLEGNTPTSDAEEDGFSEDEDDDNANDATEEDGDGEKRKKRKRSAPSNGARRRTSLEIAAEDSQEATVVKTLSELTSLVATSLQPFDIHPEENPQDDNHHKETEHSNLPHYSYGKGQFALTIDDSILAETGREDTGGAMELSDLGSTIAAIMHHAPVLQSRHVAVRSRSLFSVLQTNPCCHLMFFFLFPECSLPCFCPTNGQLDDTYRCELSSIGGISSARMHPCLPICNSPPK